MAVADVLPLDNHRSSKDAAAPMTTSRWDLPAICRQLARTAPPVHLRDGESRRWELLARNADFDAWLIGWAPQSGVEFHDHGGSSGAFVVLSGSLVELAPTACRDGVVEVSSQRIMAGEVLEFGPHHIHDVANEDGAMAVSLHAYAPPLQFMTYFDVELKGLVPRGTETLFGTGVEGGSGPPSRADAQ